MADPTPLPASHRYQCRGCTFNLTGLVVHDGTLTCPECGRSGPLAHVAEPEPPALPPVFRTLWRMGRWTTLLLVIAAVCGYLSNVAGDELVMLAGVVAIAAAAAGVLVPLRIAADLAAHHARERKRRAAFISLVTSGVGLNIAQAALLVIVALIVEVIINPP